jgi:hypothetical protein
MATPKEQLVVAVAAGATGAFGGGGRQPGLVLYVSRPSGGGLISSFKKHMPQGPTTKVKEEPVEAKQQPKGKTPNVVKPPPSKSE